MNPCNRFATPRGRTATPFLLFAVTVIACGGEPDPTDTDPPRETGSTTDYLVARGRVAAVVTQTNLVADEGESALTVDPDLRNPWGLTFPANPTEVAALHFNQLDVYLLFQLIYS